MIQHILEEEVTELLGGANSERKEAVDPAPGYRNGYGKPRRLAMSSGTITDAPQLLRDVYEGRKFAEGKSVSTQQRKAAA